MAVIIQNANTNKKLL